MSIKDKNDNHAEDRRRGGKKNKGKYVKNQFKGSEGQSEEDLKNIYRYLVDPIMTKRMSRSIDNTEKK